ncbi:MAG: MBL fold metallo-hydrolase, partial [Solirubrobacteraceae bacterium]|nr:MBL fold metallo-hydrolase [Solirubrobacteraceae bacterium]
MTGALGTALHGAPAKFRTGLVDVAPGICAWLQPNGDWSESNAGLVIGDGAAALIDTAWDLALTRRLLEAVGQRTAEPITTLIATHGDGDHVNGFELVPGARLVASRATAADIAHERPAGLRRSALGARLLSRIAFGRPRRFGDYVASMMEPFDFRGIALRTPDQTFERSLTLDVGGHRVDLRRLGPAHTSGDTIVHLPESEVVFAGDLLFTGVTPNAWSGTIDRWRRALHAIGELGPRVIVPGHGPLSGLAELEMLDRYWAWLTDQALRRLAHGTSVYETARQIVLSPAFAAQPWATWECPERTVMNVEMLARDRVQPHRPITHRERPALMWKVARLHHELQGHAARRRSHGSVAQGVESRHGPALICERGRAMRRRLILLAALPLVVVAPLTPTTAAA